MALRLEAYEWRQLSAVAPDELAAGLRDFAVFGGTGVALDIGAVVDISEIADPVERAEQEARFAGRLRQYVEVAAAAGLRVQALAGSPRWIVPQVRYVNHIVIDFIARFNACAPRPLHGLVLDHEPWALPAWPEQAVRQCRHLLDTVRDVVARAGVLPITVTLPFWLDGTAHPQRLDYRGASMSPTEHALRLLAEGDGRAVAIMAYRDTTGGPDGSIALTARPFDFAARYGGRVGVVIAQEMTDVQPRRITFFDEGPDALRAAMAQLRAAYGPRPGFGGFIANDLASLTAALARR